MIGDTCTWVVVVVFFWGGGGSGVGFFVPTPF